MNMQKKVAAWVAAIIGLGATALGGTPVQAQTLTPPGTAAGAGHRSGERHPELRRALSTLERVETQLRRANRDFGGHRAKAADLCHQAEQEIQRALQYDKN